MRGCVRGGGGEKGGKEGEKRVAGVVRLLFPRLAEVAAGCFGATRQIPGSV